MKKILSLEELILKGVPIADKKLLKELLPHLTTYLQKYEINKTDNRLAFFLGHCAIESDYFRTLNEYGGLSYFEKAYGRKTKALGAAGNIPPLDKAKRKDVNYWYIGRGLIQNTWDFNYKKVSDVTGIDFVAKPWLLAEVETAVSSATIFWYNNGLNVLADKNDYRGSTKKINGGYNHVNERTAYIKRFQAILAGDDISGLPLPVILPKEKILEIQEKLKGAGYHEVGEPDGIVGSRTISALAAFKIENGLTVNDEFDAETLKLLENPEQRKIAKVRAEGAPPPEDTSTNAAKKTMQASATGIGLMSIPQIIEIAKPLVAQTEETKALVERIGAVYAPVKQVVSTNPELLVIGILAVIFYFGRKAYKSIIEDYQKGAKF